MSIVMNTTGLAPVGTGRILLAAVSICETASAALRSPAAGTAASTPAKTFAYSALDVLGATIAGLPDDARGQVFIEVATSSEIVKIDAPERVTVAWLTRDSRSGRPGTGEGCHLGEALNRAVGAWVSEMVTGDPETDDDELTVGFYGPDVLFDDLRDDITARTPSSTDTIPR